MHPVIDRCWKARDTGRASFQKIGGWIKASGIGAVLYVALENGAIQGLGTWEPIFLAFLTVLGFGVREVGERDAVKGKGKA